MDTNSIYYKQVQLLMSVLPTVAKQTCFALKGGTAINLFVRDLPRLSVDIDLTYIEKGNRDESLSKIKQAMQSIQSDLHKRGFAVSESQKKGVLTRILVSNKQTQIKIETTPVMRETVHLPSMQTVTPSVEEQFGFAEINMLDFNDLYAGKLCAALDRQHPRDLYDVKLLLENEGISEELKNTFLVYLISSPRPMVELVKPNRKPLEEVYEKEFETMTNSQVSVEQLEETREQLISNLHNMLTDFDKEFLLDIKRGTADWANFYYPHVEQLPAVAWKLINLDKMSTEARNSSRKKLEQALYA
ncbi:nucleotidyl transferase AbiEii/AbiGii toxin family protein [Arenicella xantha]|uniref:Putative nucleotidyltransferase component of viral defense system n=1 Tax=Arenicella xantha TaxID=644221 RepID=A0A395JNF6_9GAMM|nr:nucleotidyl transferase AbiEii/AbiGii toxin family protein [Arenicella xantha]RBP51327.1 putative nucleotidyltransferase component of viral defense system [Arenicella xantha]